MRELVARYLSYNNWANERLVATAEVVTPEQLHSGSLSYGSAFKTLRHMVDAEVVWRHTILADDPGADMSYVQSLNTLPELDAFWQAERHRLLAVFEALSDEDLNHSVRAPWRDKRYCIQDIFLHVVNHASNHRSEIGWYLTACGHSPGDLEYVDYLDTLTG